MNAAPDTLPEDSSPLVTIHAETLPAATEAAIASVSQMPCTDKAVFYDGREVYGC